VPVALFAMVRLASLRPVAESVSKFRVVRKRG